MKEVFLILYLLGHMAHADLNTNLQMRINTYNVLIEHNRSEAVALEQKIQDIYGTLQGESESLKDIRETVKTFDVTDLVKTMKKNGNRLANAMGAAIATYQNQDRIPTADELKSLLDEATHPEHFYEMYETLIQAYETRLQEIQRLEERRNQLLTGQRSGN